MNTTQQAFKERTVPSEGLTFRDVVQSPEALGLHCRCWVSCRSLNGWQGRAQCFRECPGTPGA